MNKTSKETVECPYCNGKGALEHLSHIANGICFQCHGTGTLVVEARSISKKVRDALAAARYRDMQRNSKYILVDEVNGEQYGDDLAQLADACEYSRSLVKWGDPREAAYIIHREDSRPVTRREVAEARR